jgi:hypothetical protein
MLNQTWFGNKVPTNFTTYNDGIFPYWSSSAMTEVLALVALSKYQKVEVKTNKLNEK